MNAFLDGLKALGAARLIALGGVAATMLVMLGLLATRSGSAGPMSLLYADLDQREAGQMVESLERAHIAHQEPGSGDRILVPAGDVARARMLLAKEGLPANGSIGYEIFDRGDAMTQSDFQQEINQTRALEGEIARSIRMISGIRAARVHIVLPKRPEFSRDEQPAQASVILTMAGSGRLDAGGVQAILNLVSAAVPRLKPQNIAVIDSHGSILARAGQPNSADLAASGNEEIRRTTELRISRAIEEMLEQTLGPGHVRAEASVEMNFDHVNETTENYNPDQQVVRSTQTTSDNSRSTEGEKPTTVQNNLPNADAGSGGQNGSQQQKSEETTNYEIGRTVRTLIHEQPQIARITVAVLVDGKSAMAGGKTEWMERGADELGRMKTLVQSAIGFNAKRGDTVEVVSMRFSDTADMAGAAPAGFLGMMLDKGDIIGLAQTAVLGGVILFGLLFVVRPLMVSLTGVRSISLEDDPMMLAAGGGGGGSGGGGARALAAGGVALLPDESLVDVANIEGQMRASSIRRLGELVEKHPDESLAIIRNWLGQERG
jgi:flagellar M-ring protein FliF